MMKFSAWTVRAKLSAAFGLMVALLLVLGLGALRALAIGHEQFSDFVTQSGHRVSVANDLMDATNDRAIGARNLLQLTQPAEREAERAAIVRAHEQVGAAMAELKKAFAHDDDVSDRERELFAEIEKVEARYGPVALGIVQLAMEGRRDEATQRMLAECRPLLAALRKASDDYVHHLEAVALAEVKAANTTHATNRAIAIGVCVVAALLAGAMALLITRDLTRALGAEPVHLGDAARRVADGDLSPLPGAAAATRGSVLASLADMQAALARVVGQVRAASDSIATGSAQIATGNADLSQRTEEQASNLQQTAASMEQMSGTVRQNADTARQAATLASAASTAAAEGGEVVGRVVTTMGEISDSARRIGEIIGVIDGIAFQTNILALNAAVEAARAGEQGRGFAVVAGEVRTLAQRSAEAAREIKSLIGASTERVEAGTQLVGAAGAAMGGIVDQVRRVADLLGEISNATSEQTTGIGQVSDAVTQLDQVTQQNAALVEESAAAADSLKLQAARLAELVSVFRLSPAAA